MIIDVAIYRTKPRVSQTWPKISKTNYCHVPFGGPQKSGALGCSLVSLMVNSGLLTIRVEFTTVHNISVIACNADCRPESTINS